MFLPWGGDGDGVDPSPPTPRTLWGVLIHGLRKVNPLRGVPATVGVGVGVGVGIMLAWAWEWEWEWE